MTSKRTLKEILDSEYVEDSDEEQVQSPSGVESECEEEPDPSLCIECTDMKTEVICKDCQEHFCVVCFGMIHRNGRRKAHDFIKLTAGDAERPVTEDEQKTLQDATNMKPKEEVEDGHSKVQSMLIDKTSIDEKMLAMLANHAKFIPMRLTGEERHLLRLLEAALQVSEYTDRVDILSYKSKAKRIVEQLKEMCSVLCGLVIASSLKAGQKLLEMKNFNDNAEWFQHVFEIGRRYKIMNPEKMRDTYGKLCYMVMDSRLPQIEEHMEFHLYEPIKTVHTFLTSRPEDNGNALHMFEDKLILYATSQISPTGKTRSEISRLIKQKESAIEKLASKYCSKHYSKDDIRQVLYSIGDYNAYINMNRRPIMRMLERLEVFRSSEIASKYSIGIHYGRNGARLTHDHNRQMHYVQQSLTLWSVIQREMIHLWYIADQDLYSPTSYRLASTGQGLNRIKACPALYREMHNILNECRSKCDAWVGSSVIHLGDDAVPNALFFLDKYTQVPNILIPFDQTLLKINDLVKNDPNMLEYVNKEYGSPEGLKLTILQDAFAHMFDGSGADNFYMSGSCIDGRLTSAWNHTNEISKKKYYNIFLMTGFIGFNGTEGF
ncbi:LAFE_0G12310g1_1 [Lachancea fermentati]|uniref:LAFE_0G12310g1_1 n=1 Tax=Lachancea fermentati TaxID=4955 RepID=A0A1G4MHZ2_LACFM|nr:LAFE_0G12310g1_1 [Lachancea fermentati]